MSPLTACTSSGRWPHSSNPFTSDTTTHGWAAGAFSSSRRRSASANGPEPSTGSIPVLTPSPEEPMIPLDDPMSLSLLFHLNSEPWLNDGAYRSAVGPQERKQIAPLLAEIPLPAVLASTVMELGQRRESCRAFSTGRLQLLEVASLLS